MPTPELVLDSESHASTDYEAPMIIDEESGEPFEWVPVAAERSYAIVHAWHNDNHFGAFRFCDEQPCRALNRGHL